ncbi:MAG: hypothetical protein ACK5LN_15045, partial [Propioniciclava sp.]
MYGRYRLYSKDSSGQQAPDCADVHCRPAAAPVPEDIGFLEVERTCQPYGLANAEHHQLLRSVFAGFSGVDVALRTDDTTPPPTTWKQWRTPCQPIDLAESVDLTTDWDLVSRRGWLTWLRDAMPLPLDPGLLDLELGVLSA